MGIGKSELHPIVGKLGIETYREPARPVTLELGFDAASGRITIDGVPQGEPIPAALALNRMRKRMSHLRRLMSAGCARAYVWAAMPKPPKDDE